MMATRTVAGLVPIIPCPEEGQRQQQRQKTVDQLKAEERRKQRNREHARRSRERKRNEQSRLEKELEELRRENVHLQRLVKEHLPNPQKLLHECNNIDRTDFELLQSLAANKQSYVISDPRLADNPIVYASERFCLLTGYSREEIVGRNCRILQGPQTDPRAVAALGKACENGSDCTTTLLNYKKDGSPFWNRVFVAALRDAENNIVNYVGVQCQQDHGPEEKQPAKRRKKMNKTRAVAGPSTVPSTLEPIFSIEPVPLPPKSIEVAQRGRDFTFDETQIDPKNLDWSMLAEVFEADEMSVCDGSVNSQSTGLSEDTEDSIMLESPLSASLAENLSAIRIKNASPTDEVVETESFHESYMRAFCASPLEIISRTVRSELLDSLMSSQGDVGDNRFLSVVAILERIYESLGYNASPTNKYTGTWRSLDRPHYGDCLGRNDNGDFMYTLGKMSFDMFQPCDLKCSVQRTLNNIETVCQMSSAPSAAPWSLRRELAAWDPNQDDNAYEGNDSATPPQSSSHLKSYDIAVALTVEPYAEKPLKALNVTKGYMLPDPKTPNRLTVWFTGGTLSPVVNNNAATKEEDTTSLSPYGGIKEWKALFGSEYTRTWSESFRVMGAKLLMGAELPDGMEEDGTMKYMLHRPMGGHGSAFVDVLYLDDDLLILKSSSGKIHVMARDNQPINEQQQQQAAGPPPTAVSSSAAVEVPICPKKRSCEDEC